MVDFSFCLRLQRWLFIALLLISSLFKMLVCCSSWIPSILIFLKHCINIILILIAGLFDAPLNSTPEARARSPYAGRSPATHSHDPAVGVHSLLWQQLFCTGNQEKVSSSSCSLPLSASEHSRDHTVPHQPSRPLLGRAGFTTVAMWHPPKAGCQVADDRLKRQAERKTDREQARCLTSSQRHGKPRRSIRTYIV